MQKIHGWPLQALLTTGLKEEEEEKEDTEALRYTPEDI